LRRRPKPKLDCGAKVRRKKEEKERNGEDYIMRSFITCIMRVIKSRK
jgi:hypothetical protein